MTMQAVYDRIDANADECVRDLQTFVRQPSISAQDLGLRDCATLLRDMMRRDGLPADLHELEQGPPVVFGHLRAKRPAKTILCYAHYDVQPPEPIEAWSHGGPWSAAIVDGVLYGRGHVWIPSVLTGFANPGANLHAPDENSHLDSYLKGIKYAAAIMEHFGRS